MLINMKSRLTDLRFGNDQPGYGSSGEPFIQTPVPPARGFFLQFPGKPIYTPGTTGGLDYPSRGGAPSLTRGLQVISKFNDIDAQRIEKFLKSAPRGTAFIQKQIGLQLSNPKTEVATTSFGPGEFGPLELTRVYTSSNTLEQVKVQGSGAHGNRHGLLAFPTNQKDYFATVNLQNVTNDKTINRLLNLNALKMTTSPSLPLDINVTNQLGISLNRGTLFQYLGGPGSVYGIGSTTINRFVDTTRLGKTIFSHVGKKVMTYDLIKSQKINQTTREDSKQKTFPEDRIQDFREQVYAASGTPKDYVPWKDWDRNNIKSSKNQIYNNLKKAGYQNILDQPEVGQRSRNVSEGGRSFAGDSEGIDYRFYTTLGNSLGRLDKINGSYPFVFNNSAAPWTYNKSETDDLIKFVFEGISNDDPSKSTAIFFRAFLNGTITDNNAGTWNSFKYFGRGEEFYTYQGFTRTMGFSFTVVAQSYYELQPMYNRLNALISQVYPDYSKMGIMRAPIVRITVGDYIYRMAALLDSVNVTLAQDAAWETEDGKQLPFKAEVQVGFKPIPEDLPRRYAPGYQIPRLIAQTGSFIQNVNYNSTNAFTKAPETPDESLQNIRRQIQVVQTTTPIEQVAQNANPVPANPSAATYTGQEKYYNNIGLT